MANAFSFIDFKKLVLIPKIIILYSLLIQSCNCNSLCSPEFCNSYLATESCLPLPEACKIQNSTNNGIFLPSPDPCNCCEYCLENLDANELCSIGDPSSPSPSTICGPGLTCTMKTDLATCQQMTTSCTLEQLAYDSKVNSGKIGHLERRTDCDRNGMHKPYKCIPGEICFCVSAEGDRIFGEVLFTPAPHFTLTCECSRMFNKAIQIENRYLNPSEYFRCQSNGDYDVLQCIDNTCFCVDADNGHLTYPDLNPVNITSVSQSTLPCFSNKTHKEAEYYRVCEAIYAKALNKSKFYKVNGYHLLGSILPNCQLDGLYAPVQENITQ
ncbi:hypothetical protein RI129_003329 [Pyrocoelia pectoralis]|uniref:Thyroglobulin type-1 domain-containing protein n=1 Tax=Pyrocoelia pectoralis TaxID=417401 RepID=A0AAN7ZN06_9COLE